MSVKVAFLNCFLNEEACVKQPLGYVRKGHEKQVHKLKIALYISKQASYAWYIQIDAYLLQYGFKKCPYKHTLYIKSISNGDIISVCIYIDDLIFVENCKEMFDEFKKVMTS